MSQRQAAKGAGLSKKEEVRARRVASIPEAEFEALIESDNPPSITALAELGRMRRARVAQDEPGICVFCGRMFASGRVGKPQRYCDTRCQRLASCKAALERAGYLVRRP